MRKFNPLEDANKILEDLVNPSVSQPEKEAAPNLTATFDGKPVPIDPELGIEVTENGQCMMNDVPTLLIFMDDDSFAISDCKDFTVRIKKSFRGIVDLHDAVVEAFWEYFSNLSKGKGSFIRVRDNEIELESYEVEHGALVEDDVFPRQTSVDMHIEAVGIFLCRLYAVVINMHGNALINAGDGDMEIPDSDVPDIMAMIAGIARNYNTFKVIDRDDIIKTAINFVYEYALNHVVYKLLSGLDS